MRFIYMDEAGTSAKEPVAIVSGVIVDADRDWMEADALIRELVNRLVPDRFKEGFVFHAKSIWGDKKYRDGWSLDDRLHLIHSFLRTPRAVGMPVVMGSCSKDIAPEMLVREMDEASLATAFMTFASMADKYIVQRCGDREVGTIIAEDNPDKRRLLRHVLGNLRKMDFPMPGTSRDSGKPEPMETSLTVTRIIDTVHFVDKRSGPLLQIADACAFAFRRYFARQPMGSDFIRSLIGRDLNLDEFKGSKWPSGLWHSEPPHRAGQ